MPHRSNAFQQIIFLIHQQLEGQAKVTESEMLVDHSTGEKREVDVVVQSPVGEYDVILSIECRDSSRPATVEWVEQQYAKHLHLPTHKLILMSRSGFTRTATAKAKMYNIDPLSFPKAASVDWTKIVHRVKTLKVDAIEVLMLLAAGDVSEPTAAMAAALSFNSVIYTANREYAVPVCQFVGRFVRDTSVRNAVIGSLGPAGKECWTACISLADGSFVIDGRLGRLKLDMVTLVLLARRGSTVFPLQTGTFLDYQIAYGRGEGELGQMTVGIIEHEKHEPRAAILRHHGDQNEVTPLSSSDDTLPSPAPEAAMRALMKHG